MTKTPLTHQPQQWKRDPTAKMGGASSLRIVERQQIPSPDSIPVCPVESTQNLATPADLRFPACFLSYRCLTLFLALSLCIARGTGGVEPPAPAQDVIPQEVERIRQALAAAKVTVEVDPLLPPQAPLLVRCEAANDKLLLQLAQFPQIGGIHIAEGRLCTAKGYAALKNLPQLQKLAIEHAVLSPASLAAITQCSQLRSLSLIDAGLTDSSIVPLKALTRLEHLNLSQNPKITDAGLKTIAAMERLRSLHLAHCKITDKGLAQLQNLEGLRTLNVVQTAVTQEALERLADAHPNLRNIRR